MQAELFGILDEGWWLGLSFSLEAFIAARVEGD
jgi:hypothetical protein